MDTRHLEAFRAVYENGSMSAAAAVLRKSQPAISNLIARLEDEIGVKLFRRTRSRLEPTPEAATFFAVITRTLDAMETVISVSSNLKGLSSATLQIASPPGLATYVLPPVIAEVLTAHSGATARFITRSSYAVRDLGLIGAFDVGFAELPIDIHVASLEVFELTCLCVMRADHPLARETMITPQKLDSAPFITLFPEHITHVAMAEAFFAAKARWNVIAEAEFFGTACTLVQQLGAVTVVDPLTARSFAPAGLVAIPFEPKIPYRFGMFQPNARPPSRIGLDFMARFRVAMERVNAGL
ncbi:LysR family transcriptional regulator [Acetobacter sp. TBRC 12305]|uniref:LysR family transcriptional regulator n=1 Tax=Acetobacter garciniae TaxID=2817435 RepID=A0A939KRP2_9PROT|nr:LysR family transcriptional regulator [Acetobacter garciniae]MBO1325691.1 LysR family transcriptional regulator [Acetobacter garciniae]MBX0345591.1 LysR family transcriptional regulator [Acetobacter garciniae]